jgi:hypothetical protein
MNANDQFMLSLVAWRENRHGQTPGMQSVCNCVVNRMRARKQTAYQVVTAYKQFSSITAPGDVQLGLYPGTGDPLWAEAQLLAGEALGGTLADITDGSTSYYALSLAEPPYWAPTMTPTVVVAGQQFMR